MRNLNTIDKQEKDLKHIRLALNGLRRLETRAVSKLCVLFFYPSNAGIDIIADV